MAARKRAAPKKAPKRKAAKAASSKTTATTSEVAKPAGYVFGRPSVYDPAMCERVIKYGEEGKSRAWIAAKLGITRGTLYEWMKSHPDFSDALDVAKLREQAWWEDAGQENMISDREGPSINAGLYNKQMASRFREDHAERHEVTGADGGPIATRDETPLDREAAARLFALAIAHAVANSSDKDDS